jgi:predicted lipid-binding transport protein (Tim44 family)
MRTWIIAALAGAAMAIGFAPLEAEAKRFGGGKPVGTQRQGLPDKPATPPAASPTQPQAAPGAAAAGQRSGMSRWLGPIAGIAAALGLAWLLGDQLGSFVMLLLIGIAVAMLVAFVMRRMRGPQQAVAGAAAGTGRMQYSGMGHETVAAPPPSQSTGVPAEPRYASQFQRRIPEGFDADGFVREAKRSFIALQNANDRADASEIREFVTDDLFESIKADFAARGGARQETDVANLNAELLEVVTEGGMHWASIRFSGLIREEPGTAPQPFEEIWNLQKPEKGGSGWMLAGIQQVG